MSNQYPVGNQVELLFAFTTRALTPTEYATFISGGGLPAGVGQNQTTVKCNYSVNGGPWTTLSGAQVINDATGAYHSIITLSEQGDVRYYGFSLDAGNNPVAATVTNHITATPN